MGHTSLVTPYKLCKSLLIAYLVKKQPVGAKQALSVLLLREVRNNQWEREKSWDELCSSLTEATQPHHQDIISWLHTKVCF